MTSELKTLEGQIASIDPENRFFTLENKDGIIFCKIMYGPQFDQQIARQKIGYYEKVPVEIREDSSNILQDIKYVQRPADWPRKSSKGSGKQYQPRNERIILFQNMHTAAVQAALQIPNLQHEGRDKLMDWAFKRAVQDTEMAYKKYGGS